MSRSDPYQLLQADPVWGPQIAIITALPEAERARPALAGGAVRDLMLGREINDLDIATGAPNTARQLAAAFTEITGRKLVEYTHRQEIFRVAAPDAPQVDFTDPIGGNREADLLRRDFTINALALGLVGDEAGAVIDPVGGLEDLQAGVVRATGPAVFEDDPLRTLRAFRFSAELGFEIDPLTLEQVVKGSLRLREVAGERIQLELLAVLVPDGAAEHVAAMDSAGLLRSLFPELAWQKGLEQNDYHHLDVWDHTLETLRQLERTFRCEETILQPHAERIAEYVDFRYPSGHSRRSLLKLAMLLHDIAKPHCRGEREDGRVTFIGHERQGADLVHEHLERLRFPAYERDFVCQVIQGHLRPSALCREEADRRRTAYRFFRDFGECGLAIALVSLADRLSAQGPRVTEEVNERHRGAIAFLLKSLFDSTEIVVRPPTIIDGGTLIHELGLEPGPIIGHLLRRVQEAQVTGEVSTKEEALELCRKVIRR